MRILSVLGFAAYWGSDLSPAILDATSGKTIGGGEEAGLRTAAGLAALGHEVHLHWCGLSGEWRGVKFYGPGDNLYGRIVGEKWDVIIGWSTLRPLEWANEGVYRIYAQQLNDLWTVGDWSKVDCIVSPSADHAVQVPSWGWHGARAVVHNGLDAENYSHVPLWTDRPMDVGYWSSPDRGLHHLLRAWPEVHQKIPEARLHVFYEIDRWLEMALAAPGPLGDRARQMNHLLPRAKADSSVVFHGAVPRHQLRQTQLQCRLMVYPYQPTGYCEGFCGSMNQAIAAGCHVMACPHDALPSLYPAVTWLPTLPEDVDRTLAPTIIRGLVDTQWSTDRVRSMAPSRLRYTWDAAALEIERACKRETL